MASSLKLRKNLRPNALLRLVRQRFEQIPDHSQVAVTFSLADVLMAAYAMFSLKDPSLLAFDKRRQADENLQSVYHLQKTPCDTQMRAILDPVSPEDLRPLFKYNAAKSSKPMPTWPAAT